MSPNVLQRCDHAPSVCFLSVLDLQNVFWGHTYRAVWMICSSCDMIASHIDITCLAETWHDTDSVAFDVCALPVTKWSIVHVGDHRQSCRRCQPTVTEWQLCLCPAFVCRRSLSALIQPRSSCCVLQLCRRCP